MEAAPPREMFWTHRTGLFLGTVEHAAPNGATNFEKHSFYIHGGPSGPWKATSILCGRARSDENL